MAKRDGAWSAKSLQNAHSEMDQGLLRRERQCSRPRRENGSKQLAAICGLCIVLLGAEVAGGIVAKSLAILTDAAHLFSNIILFSISLAAVYLAKKPPTAEQPFGYRRLEILGALLLVLLAWAVTGFLVYFATLRMWHPVNVNGEAMLVVAIAGLFMNIGVCTILRSGVVSDGYPHVRNHRHSQGLREALLHVVGNVLQSIGVCVASALIYWNPQPSFLQHWLGQSSGSGSGSSGQTHINWMYADPICTCE